MAGKPWTAIAPLVNFSSESSDPIRVFEDVQIRRLTDADRGAEDQNSMFRFLKERTTDVVSGVPDGWTLAGDFEQPWESTVLESRFVQERFARVASALHLLHDEMVDFPFIMLGEGRPPAFSMGTRDHPFPTLRAWQRANGRPYVLRLEEHEPLRRLSLRLLNLLNTPPIDATEIAIERLDATHQRSSDPDRIIDSSIALESILLKGSEDELSYRQAIRGAHLLGGSTDERQETFRLFRKTYDRRSKIVHGGTDPGRPTAAEVVSLTREVVRAFVDRPTLESHDALIRRLDAQALGAREDMRGL